MELLPEDQSWLHTYVKRVVGLCNVTIPRKSDARSLLRVVHTLDPEIGHSDTVQNFFNPLDFFLGFAGSQNSELLLPLIQLRDAIRDVLSPQMKLSDEYSQQDFIVWWNDVCGGGTRLEADIVKLIGEPQVSIQQRIQKVLESLAHFPLKLLLRSYLTHGLPVLDDILQPTEAESLVCAPLGSDRKEALNVGYPLPSTVMTQRDFLQIDVRKRHLAELRVQANPEKLAAYEEDCFNAIYTSILGFAPAVTDPERKQLGDNYNFSDILYSRLRGCGGAALQIAFWIKELGLNAFISETLESPLGDEGHFSFFALNAKGELHFFDPSLRVPYQKVPQEYFKEKNIAEKICQLSRGLVRKVHLEVEKEELAYQMNTSPRVRLLNMDDGLFDLVSTWVAMDSRLTEDDALSFISALEKIEGNHVGLPFHLLWKKLHLLKRKNSRDSLHAHAQVVIAENPHSIASLYDAGFAFLDIGRLNDAFTVVQAMFGETIRVTTNLQSAIALRTSSECAPGGYVLPVLYRYVAIMEKVTACLEHTTLFCQSVSEEGEDAETIPMVDQLISDGKMMYECFLREIMSMRTFMMTRTITAQQEEAIMQECGKVTMAYTDFLTVALYLGRRRIRLAPLSEV